MKQRTAARVAWSVLGIAVVLAAVAMTITAIDRPASNAVENALFVAIFMAMGAVGAVIVGRHHRNAVGWILLAVAVCAGLAFLGGEYGHHAAVVDPGSLPGAAWAWWLADFMWIGILAFPTTFLLLLFPDGRVPSPRWRPFLWTLTVFIGAVVVVFALDPTSYAGGLLENPIGVQALRPVARFLDGPGYLILVALAVISATSLVLRYRRAERSQRQQIKWFLYAVSLLVLYFLLDAALTTIGVEGGFWVENVLPALAFASLPVGLAIAILKHGLYDIDVVINRTVVFGLLAAFITAVYVGMVIGIGSLVGSRGNVLLSIVATALIAVAFQPLRVRARHLANRLVYGKRAQPYELLSEFSEQLAGSYSADDVLPRMARLVAEGTGAIRARVWLRVGADLRAAASWPTTNGHPPPARLLGDEVPEFHGEGRAFAVRHQGELLGALTVSMPARESLGQTQERLVADVAAQAGLILRNVRLIEELRDSRQRIVAAQDAERRRLERNIHDGAQQQLVALAVKLRLARAMTAKDVERAQSLLDQLQGETQEAMENLRDLARGIYPPLLADQGLAAALQAQARKVPFPVEVEPNGVTRYPAEAEATAYFCVLEALQNAAKYAEPSRAVVRLGEEDGRLVFSVSDDGSGFDVKATAKGSGLQNMADRLDALGGSIEVTSSPGGGTTITGRIPVQASP
jgi:signal transduction histidine kinase